MTVQSSQPMTLQSIVNEQAEDPALWCLEPTIAEHMLQIALRRLHAAIEAAAQSPQESE